MNGAIDLGIEHLLQVPGVIYRQYYDTQLWVTIRYDMNIAITWLAP
jgi:hypothetical protein